MNKKTVFILNMSIIYSYLDVLSLRYIIIGRLRQVFGFGLFENTIQMSWFSETEKKYQQLIQKITGRIGNNRVSKIIVLMLYLVMRIQTNGLPKTIKQYYNILKLKIKQENRGIKT
jgi:hypothetical protein